MSAGPADRRSRYRWAAVAGILAMAPDAVWPQELPPPSATILEEVVVTGSHLPRTDRAGPAPVDIIEAEDLARSGMNTLADFARYLTFNAGVPNDEVTAATNAPGTSFFNLRGIGAQATLTLVNGWRIAPNGAPQTTGHTFVDLNSIPLSAIERIELLKDGASAIYGSEAIAGVVNVILKQDYDGLTVGGGYLTTTRQDAEETTADLTWGLRREQTSLVATASYLQREPLLALDRAFLAEPDLRGVGGFNNRLQFSSPLSAFRRDIRRVQSEPACPINTDNPIAHLQTFNNHPVIDSICRFNQKLFIHSIPETERIGMTGMARHRLGDSTELFVDAIVNRNESRTQLPPPITDKTPLDIFFPLVEADHPDNPFGSAVEINYLIVDAGPVRRNSEALSWRLASGLEGKRGAWNWSAAALWSVSEIDTEQFNLVDSVSFQDALLGMGGPDGNQFYNPFGFLPENPPEVIAGFKLPVSLRFEQARERAINLDLSRRIFDLSGGPAELALGYQYRDQRSIAQGDAFQTSGTALGVELLRPLDATRDIHSVYIELALPVTARLELQLAARHERYSDFGGTTDPKLAARWQATDDFAVRGSIGTSFRAPTFTELFEAVQDRFVLLVDNPRCELTGAPLDCSPAPYDVRSGGNEDLRPEEGRSWYLGAVWSPGQAKAFELNIDLWRFVHDDRIVELDPQFIIDELGANSDLVVRGVPLPTDPPGTPGRIERVVALKVNADQLLTQGVDLGGRYRLSTTRWGDFQVDMSHTYLDEFTFKERSNDALVNRNLAGGSELFPLPRLRSNLTLAWSRGAHRSSATLHYVGSYRSRLNRVVDRVETGTRIDIADHSTLDVQYEHEFAQLRNGRLRVGCQNCTDAKPPVYNYTASGEQLHDPRGAIFYVRWQQPF